MWTSGSAAGAIYPVLAAMPYNHYAGRRGDEIRKKIAQQSSLIVRCIPDVLCPCPANVWDGAARGRIGRAAAVGPACASGLVGSVRS